MKGVVIDKGEKYFTFLGSIFGSIENIHKDYNWLITGHECYPQNAEYVEKLSKEWCWMTGEESTEMIEDENFQWIFLRFLDSTFSHIQGFGAGKAAYN